MKRLVFTILISFVLGLLAPYILTIKIYSNLINTLYTVAGILFSVGMSIVVTISTQDIHNQEAKKEVQAKINTLLVQYIAYFVALTIFYVLIPSSEDKQPFLDIIIVIKQIEIDWNYSLSYLLLLLFIMAFFVYNMMKVRRQKDEIEQIIDSEINNN